MGSSKSGKAAAGTWPLAVPARRLVAWLVGPARGATLAVLMIAAFVLVAWIGWQRVRDRVLGSPDYLVGPEQVEIRPLPPWIHHDIRADVFRDASLDGPVSILDDSLADRLASAFALHPWVAKVRRVSKRHPARVVVELDYRQPVLMVASGAGLIPVDSYGTVLPAGDFSAVEAAGYPRLVGVDTPPLGTVGQPWGDARVAGAAIIAYYLTAKWGPFGLSEIQAVEPANGRWADGAFVLTTRAGTKILWGKAPLGNRTDEPSPEAKIARLDQFVRQYGSLDGGPPGAPPLDLSR